MKNLSSAGGESTLLTSAEYSFRVWKIVKVQVSVLHSIKFVKSHLMVIWQVTVSFAVQFQSQRTGSNPIALVHLLLCLFPSKDFVHSRLFTGCVRFQRLKLPP